MGMLEDLQPTVQDLVDTAGGAVVAIGGTSRGGSGFVVADGQVLTNAHNVRGQEIAVTFADGRRATGAISGMDADGDLVVVSVETVGVSPIAWSTGQAALGSPVFGLTLTGQGPRVTFGLVSSLARAFRGPRGRRISGSIEHTAPLAPGSSGGPLLGAGGELLGINTNRIGAFYLAIPADASLRARVEALGRGDSPVRPRLGLGLAPAGVARRMRRAVGLPEREGLLVRAVEADTPAARAGLREGDLLVAAGRRPLVGLDDLHDVLGAPDLGSSLTLRIVRGTDELELSITFAGEQGDYAEAQSGDGPSAS
ncbi:trypsin-like peptidase domain-containing protein [soil metagenome]